MMGFDTEKILSDVPRLRRYATLMCANDKDRGDVIVEKALKDAVAHPDELTGKSDYRAVLFRHLQRRLASELGDAEQASQTVQALTTGHSAVVAAMLDRLADMPLEQRSVLLLVAVEGLDHEQVGYVVGTTGAIVHALLTDARIHLGIESRNIARTA